MLVSVSFCRPVRPEGGLKRLSENVPGWPPDRPEGAGRPCLTKIGFSRALVDEKPRV